MNFTTRKPAWMFAVAILGSAAWAFGQTTQPSTAAPKPAPAAAAAPAPAPAGPAHQPATKTGSIKGDNVYIRSGFSTNYYPVTKLNQGDQVTIVGQEYGWLQILPPAGTHSLVEKVRVNRNGEDKIGTVNGNDTWILAGSNIDKRHYARQKKMDKGDQVEILGQTPEGDFYQIVPPPGATVWVASEFVSREGKVSAAEASPKAKKAIEPVKTGTLKDTLPELEDAVKPTDSNKQAPAPAARPNKSAKAAPAKKGNEHAGLQSSDQFQITLNAIETEIQAEETKPPGQRTYAGAIEKLQPIAAQKGDEVARLYAQARLSQLKDQIEVGKAVDQVKASREQADNLAREFEKKRDEFRKELLKSQEDFAIKGEIKMSGVYDGGASRPLRWRIVEPGKDRTIAYVELAPDSPINPVQFYGKYIGIKASSRQILKGTIPPLPLLTVQEIVLLDPQTQSRMTEPQSGSESTGRSASPMPAPIAAPTSQPAGEEVQ